MYCQTCVFFNSEKWKWIMEILSTITQSTMKAEASLETVANVSEIRDEKDQNDLFCLFSKCYYREITNLQACCLIAIGQDIPVLMEQRMPFHV